MNVNKLAGGCLLIFGSINVLHEIVLNSRRPNPPGFGYTFLTALLFTLGAVLILRRNVDQNNTSQK